MTPEEVWKRFKPGRLYQDPRSGAGPPDVNVYHVGDVDTQAVAAIAAAIADEREAIAKMGDARAAAYGQKRSGALGVTMVETAEGTWWRARQVEAADYAAAIRARTP